uniref:Uncharacterized protein n=1 Tax=Rhizophagus irregularis (strain DAOM 181602 / DAOM 197198 / MUCL 43194) TaxID=747089 RepID=U9SW71_RHIID
MDVSKTNIQRTKRRKNEILLHDPYHLGYQLEIVKEVYFTNLIGYAQMKY